MSRPSVNFVSNLPKDLRSGGFSAMNAAALAAVSDFADTHYCGPINPRVLPWQSALSKLLRACGAAGDFFYFSRQRLETVAREVATLTKNGATLDFFHGFTPWIMSEPGRPYMAWSDCTFSDYIDIYHARDRFRTADLQRIEQTEARWLKRATRVLFTSHWAAQRAVAHYRLDTDCVGVAGIYGQVDMPPADLFLGAKTFAFVSTDFEAKGGPTVLAALAMLRKRHPDASLVVIGDRPARAASKAHIEFAGFLRKEVPRENSRFHEILGRARAIVHPTRSDIAPLLLIEAGYFGCPVISSRRYAIPELVEDRRTGLLLDDPADAQAVAGAMAWMLENDQAYCRMREAAWARAREAHSRAQFEDRMTRFLREAASEAA